VLFGAAREATRNAARYGRANDTGRALHLVVTATVAEGNFAIQIEDDGVGIAAALVAGNGAADSDDNVDGLADRTGQGLALHSTMMAVIGGTLTAESPPGGGTRVTLTLPAPPDAAAGLIDGAEDGRESNSSRRQPSALSGSSSEA
jgi:signal transduction histidine kinase